MKKVVVWSVLFVGVSLHGMELARLSGSLSHNHSINGVEGEAYQVLSAGAQTIEVEDEFTPTVLFSEEHNNFLRDFSPQMVSDACMELESDTDYQALKSAWHNTLRQDDGESKALERSVAVKLFSLLARKEVRETGVIYEKLNRWCCPCLTFHIVGIVLLAVGPGSAFLDRWLRCR